MASKEGLREGLLPSEKEQERIEAEETKAIEKATRSRAIGNIHREDSTYMPVDVIPAGQGTSFFAKILRSTEEEAQDMMNLFCAWSIGFLTAIEGTVSQPSLWLYVQSLGGDRKFYSNCVFAFPLGRLMCMGIFGMWADRRPFSEVMYTSLFIAMSSGLLYAAAPTVGIWCLPAARFVLGAMSCQTVAVQAFVALNTSREDRTKYMSINSMITNSLNVAGPAFNVFLVMLPEFDLTFGGRTLFVFNNYTWVGYFLFICQLICIIFFRLSFTSARVKRQRRANKIDLGNVCLERCTQVVTLGGFFPWTKLFVDPWIRMTGAWILFAFNSRNQFTNFAVTWIVPVITDRDYHFGQIGNSMIFVGLAAESVIASFIVSAISKKVNDRNSLVGFQIISHIGLLIYTICSNFGSKAIPLPLFVAVLVWYDFGAPASQVQSLYSKLIGPGSQAIYFSVLQSNGAVGRLMAAEVTKLALAAYGMPCLWVSVHVMWIFQWAVLGANWRRLHPDTITAMHERLDETPLGKQMAKGKAKAKAKAKVKSFFSNLDKVDSDEEAEKQKADSAKEINASEEKEKGTASRLSKVVFRAERSIVSAVSNHSIISSRGDAEDDPHALEPEYMEASLSTRDHPSPCFHTSMSTR